MNTSVVIQPVLAPPSTVASVAVLGATSGFASRVKQQLWRDFTLLRYGLLLLWINAVYQMAAVGTGFDSLLRIPSAEFGLPFPLWDGFCELLSMMLVAVCILADAPACTRAQSHTLPVGRSAMWLAKLVMLVIGIGLPVFIGDLAARSGFGYGWHEWTWFVAGDLLVLTCMIFLSAAVTSLADTSGRAAVYAASAVLIATLAIGIGTFALDEWIGWKSERTEGSLTHCRQLVSWGIAGVLGFVAWSVMTFTRRWTLATTVLIACIVQPLLVMRLWHHDWHQTELRTFSSAQLSLEVAKDGTMPSAPGTQMLWPGLQLRGLPPQHFATVVSLSPFSAAHALPVWALPYSYSDYERDGSDYNSVVDWRQRTGVALDQARTIAAHYPAGLIWADPGESPVRPPLAAIIDRHREPRLQSSQPWHLRLHVQSMRQVADLPLADLLSRPCSVAMAPGLRLDLRPYPAAPNRAPILSVQGILNRTWPSMAPDPIRVLKDKGGRPPLFQFQSVTRDMVKNECVVDSQVLRIEPKNYVIAASSAIAWPTLRITAPTIRLGITGQSVRDWVKQVRVQIWVPEDAGLAELTVSQELLKQAR